jgi:hypothetical protein
VKRLFAITCSFLLLFSCNNQDTPKNLLSEDKMVSVLADIHLTEGIASAMPVSYDSSQVLYTLMEKDVFVKHQVSDSLFTESMRYYLQYPGIMDKIYARVIDTLVVWETTPMSEENN